MLNVTFKTDWQSLHGDFFHDVRVLITGGAGFIGSHLATALKTLGADVVVIDNLSSGRRENLPASIDLAQASILDDDALARAARGCRFVFHEAAMASVPLSIEKPAEFHEINGTGTLKVLEAARRSGAQRVIFAASSSAYGDSGILGPKVETMPVLPKSPYAATKVYGETLMRAYSASFALDAVSLRYFNIFGPRQTADSAYAAVIAAFAKQMLSGQTPVIFGDGTQSRDFTYVDNAVHANLLAARAKRALAGEVINVGCGKAISINNLATSMRQILNRPDLLPDHRPFRPGDVMHSLADLDRASELLEYQPIVDFTEGLSVTLEWYGGQI